MCTDYFFFPTRLSYRLVFADAPSTMRHPPPPLVAAAGTRPAAHLTFVLLLLSLLPPSSAIVFLRTAYNQFLFDDAPAAFGPALGRPQICGSLRLADPVDGCMLLRNGSGGAVLEGSKRGVVLVERGHCSFVDKVQNAQDAGYSAVIIYDNQHKGNLILMLGDSQGIEIPSVFISNEAGEIMKQFADSDEGQYEVCIASDEAIQTVLTISLISLIVIASILAIFLFTQNLRARRLRNISQSTSISARVVNKFACFQYSSSTHSRNGSVGEACTICLEDYKDGDSLRVLPCQHEFHAVCVDSWLTKWGTFCPLCKHDMRAGPISCRISEQTPLLPC